MLNRALLGRSWGGSGRREAESYDLLPHRPAGGVRRSCLSLKLATRRVSVHFHDFQYTRTAFPYARGRDLGLATTLKGLIMLPWCFWAYASADMGCCHGHARAHWC